MPKVKYCVTEFTPTANLLSPLWPLGLWTLATNGTQEGGGYRSALPLATNGTQESRGSSTSEAAKPSGNEISSIS